MQALRVIKEPRNHQVVIDLPPGLGSAARVEVIVFAADELAVPAAADEKSALRSQQAAAPGTVKRRPSPQLAATRITGDLMSPTVPDADWNALK
jgi:hypothetical protein